MNSSFGNATFLAMESLDRQTLFDLKAALAARAESELESSAAFCRVLDLVKTRLQAGMRAILLSLEFEGKCPLSIEDLSIFTPILANALGDLLVQNEKGDKVIYVYDRDRLGSMYDGARYHQTREGGTIHTDNVNIPKPWDYLLFSCLAAGEAGGESILVDGVAVHQCLKDSFPRALKTLEEKFYWEMRGVADSLYQAPIITYDQKGLPLFRHLRPYMESAHRKAGVSLTLEQLYAVDVLDALTNSLRFQTHYSMRQGDHLISVDSQVLHGRTCFSDSLDSVTIDEYLKGTGKKLKRTMERVWLTKK